MASTRYSGYDIPTLNIPDLKHDPANTEVEIDDDFMRREILLQMREHLLHQRRMNWYERRLTPILGALGVIELSAGIIKLFQGFATSKAVSHWNDIQASNVVEVDTTAEGIITGLLLAAGTYTTTYAVKSSRGGGTGGRTPGGPVWPPSDDDD